MWRAFTSSRLLVNVELIHSIEVVILYVKVLLKQEFAFSWFESFRLARALLREVFEQRVHFRFPDATIISDSLFKNLSWAWWFEPGFFERLLVSEERWYFIEFAIWSALFVWLLSYRGRLWGSMHFLTKNVKSIEIWDLLLRLFVIYIFFFG